MYQELIEGPSKEFRCLIGHRTAAELDGCVSDRKFVKIETTIRGNHFKERFFLKNLNFKFNFEMLTMAQERVSERGRRVRRSSKLVEPNCWTRSKFVSE